MANNSSNKSPKTRTKAICDEAFLAAIPVPEGFASEAFVEDWPGMEAQILGRKFVGHDGTTSIRVESDQRESDWLIASGHVDFKTSQGRFSFDRRGVEDSFYVDAGDTPEDVGRKIEEQIARVLERRAAHEKAEKVPFFGHVVTPERRAEMSAALRAGRTATLRPSGFGTAYVLSAKKRRGPEAGLARPDVAAFFGLKRVYVEKQDWD